MGEIVDNTFIMAQTAAAMTPKPHVIETVKRKPNTHTIPGIEMEIHFPKKAPKKKEAPKQRIVICGTTSWSKPKVIAQTLKGLDKKTIEFVVTGTGRGAEQLTVQACKAADIILYQAHTLKDKFISYDAVIRTFKPSLIIAFNENPEENTITEGYRKLARRKNIDFRMISK